MSLCSDQTKMGVSTWWAVAVWRGSVVSKLPVISFVSYSPWENMVFNRGIFFVD